MRFFAVVVLTSHWASCVFFLVARESIQASRGALPDSCGTACHFPFRKALGEPGPHDAS